MLKQKISNKNIFILILLILLILFFSYILFKNIINNKDSFGMVESFGGEGESAAFDVTTYKKWTFPNADGKWYTVIQNGYKINFTDTGLNVNNKQLSILFLYNCLGKSHSWRTIFRFTNDGQDNSNDSRVPLLKVIPNSDRLYLRMSTNSGVDDGLNLNDISPPFGIPIFIAIVIDNNKLSFYINGALAASNNNMNVIHSRNSNTKFSIGDQWYGGSGVNIKNFTLYDGALSPEDISTVYNRLQLNSGKDGSIGERGDQGPSGDVGQVGYSGEKGEKGDIGEQGPRGDPGNFAYLKTKEKI
jgi:hypothetical protein